MLVLERKKDEDIEITTPAGEVILVKVLSLTSGRVKLGFTSPLTVKILRSELVGKEKRSVESNDDHRGSAGSNDEGSVLFKHAGGRGSSDAGGGDTKAGKAARAGNGSGTGTGGSGTGGSGTGDDSSSGPRGYE